ncbi:Uridine kinase-like protein 2, chloroplastic [Artemisia annua]|uniref:Uridine kinase-like protein 2, chloroplastic n=1 Tax=Artemisia annua TaxID=35608 RepID=A0A2U1MHW0_ARTAN|nr:Uridine kinase-like protein 2, chloroplastic [Artemisia annua]
MLDADVRLARRIRRDTVEKDRDVNSALEQIRGMHTLIRDQDMSKHDFVVFSYRLIRLVVEHGLGLPLTEKQITTPTGLSGSSLAGLTSLPPNQSIMWQLDDMI